MICIILAGGYGKRLWPLTKAIPKPLLPIRDKTVLDYIMERILEIDEINKIILSTNLKFRDQFEKWAEKYPEVEIEVKVEMSGREEEKPGAVKALYNLVSQLSDDSLILAGDNLFTSQLNGLLSRYGEIGEPMIALYDVGRIELAKMYGVVEVDSNWRIIGFEEKPENPKSTLVSTGIYVYPKKVFPMIGEYLEKSGKADRLGDFIQWLYRRVPVYGHLLDGMWWDIGSVKTYHEALMELGTKRKL